MVGTFKIITLASSIEEKTIDLFKDTFTDSGSINVEGATLHCWKHGGHGTQTYLEVVENSCNPGFVSMGQKLGTQKLMSYIKSFGFGKKTGIDLNGESNGILFNIFSSVLIIVNPINNNIKDKIFFPLNIEINDNKSKKLLKILNL